MVRIFLVLSAVLSAAVLGVLAWNGLTERGSSSGPSGVTMVSVSVPDLAGRAVEGEALFRDNCSGCHGDNAGGREGFGPPLVHRIYEPGHHGDGSFLLAAQRGVRAHHWPFGDMPPVDTVTESDVDSIVAYVRMLQRANGIN